VKRILANLTIVAFLGTFSGGTIAHAVGLDGVHSAMYFVVWDMFCGWGAYSQRFNFVGEGASGRYYEVAPAPWGEIVPYGSASRRHYDHYAKLAPHLIRNTLRHTEHEPITRVYLIEEFWPKQFNLPGDLWHELHETPKDRKSYYHLRGIYAHDGTVISRYPDWASTEAQRVVSENPRLHTRIRSSSPFYSISLNDVGASSKSGADDDYAVTPFGN